MATSASAKAGKVHRKRRDDLARFFDIMVLLLGVLLGSPRNLAKPCQRRQSASPPHRGLRRAMEPQLAGGTEFCPNDPLSGAQGSVPKGFGSHVGKPPHCIRTPWPEPCRLYR